MVRKPESDTEPEERRIDLNVPQVAGSAVAAVAAAVAASQLGVYGTILGAGVMSVVATCGGSVFQHFFRRTGEQIREVTVHTRETRNIRGEHEVRETVPARRPAGGSMDATTVLRTVAADPEPARRPTPLADADVTRPLVPYPAVADEAFSASTTHGTRIRGWKRSALGAVAVFAVSMAGITTYELVSGNDLSGGQGTTVGSAVHGGRGSGSEPADRTPSVSTDPGQGRTPDRESGGTSGTDAQGGRSESPGAGQDDGSTAGPTPTPSPSNSVDSGTTPAPTPTPTASGGSSADPAPTGAGTAPGQETPATTGTDTGR
ncbi:hypothetical protein ABZS81_02750 [Streptomyces sp. NPDC005318]|uniref:hypothetical protein n=1 Tax=Streptomyces sp. NPDC005318 TaxID=3157031 RepID=UPI0033AE197C